MCLAVAFRTAGAVVLAVLVSVAESAELRQLRVAGSHGKPHHQHKQHRKNHRSASEHTSEAAKITPDEKFRSIQNKLMNAWKEKDHIEKLKHSIQSQKALISEEKDMVISGESEDEERRQFLEMLKMVKGSEAMVTKVRKAALKKTEQAMEEVMSIDKDADKEIEEAEKVVAEGKAKIARAKAARVTSMKTKQTAQKVLAAAVQEAKFFQKILKPEKQQKAKKTGEQSSPQARDADSPVVETRAEMVEASEASDDRKGAEEAKASEASSQDVDKKTEKTEASEQHQGIDKATKHIVKAAAEASSSSADAHGDAADEKEEQRSISTEKKAIDKQRAQQSLSIPDKEAHQQMEQAASRVVRVAAKAKQLDAKFDQWMMKERDAK